MREAPETGEGGLEAVKTNSRIEKLLGQGAFVVTSECGPPRGADAEVIRKKGELLRGVVDGVNVTDNQTSVVRMSSLSALCDTEGDGVGADPADGMP